MKIKSDYEIILISDEDLRGGVNAKWNYGVSKAKGDYILILNNDVVLTEGIDLELIKGLETHKIACPYTTRGPDKFCLPAIKNDNMIAGWCFMMRRNDWTPIDETLDIWYGDNWIYEKMNHSVYYGGLVHHYESSTINSHEIKKEIAKRIERDKMNWEYIAEKEGFLKKKKIELSILILSIPSRMDKLKALYSSLEGQLTNETEVIVYTDNKKVSIGEKRNKLLELANGEYCVMLDDDDRITNNYVSELLKGIKTGCDVIYYQVSCSYNGGEFKTVIYGKDLKNEDMQDKYYRKSNHLMCYKTKIARSVKYDDVSYGEDFAWADKICSLLETEHRIDKVLYYYIFSEKQSESFKFKLA